jgi:hypothetical protein
MTTTNTILNPNTTNPTNPYRYAVAIKAANQAKPCPLNREFGFQMISSAVMVEILTWSQFWSDARRCAVLLAHDYVNWTSDLATILILERQPDNTVKVVDEYKTYPRPVIKEEKSSETPDPYDGVPADTGTV